MSVAIQLGTEATPTEICVEVVAFRVRGGRLEVQVLPVDGRWALPVGAPIPSETLDEAARRLVADCWGPPPARMIQLGAWGRPEEGIQVVFVHLVAPPVDGNWPNAPGGAWRDVRAPRRTSGPDRVVARAVRRLQQEVELGLGGFSLVSGTFTVSDLRRVHEAVTGVPIDPSNFRKRVARWVQEGYLEELDRRRPTATRPARLYRLVE